MARERVAVGVFCVVALAATAFVVADARLMWITGWHLLAYLVFAQGPDSVSWGGGAWALVQTVGSTLAVATIFTAAAVGIGVALQKCLRVRRCRKVWTHGIPATAGGLFFLIFLCGGGAEAPARAIAVTNLPVRIATLSAWDGNDTALHADLSQRDLSGLRSLFRAPPRNDAQWRASAPRHVLMVVRESFRHDSIQPAMMPKTAMRARTGFIAMSHFAGANASQLGLFGLFYGRSASCFDEALDVDVTPIGVEMFHRAGYATRFFSSHNHIGWARMHEFLNEPIFDEMILLSEDEWPARDRMIFDIAIDRLREAEQPQFIAVFTASTHFPYLYPREYERYEPTVSSSRDFLSYRPEDRSGLLNRYRNALSYMDDEIDRLLDAIDLENTVVVITGDHGESIFDDGTLTHVTLASDAQMRVPFVMLGAGVPVGSSEAITQHVDIMPTLADFVGMESDRGYPWHGASILTKPVDAPAILAPMQPSTRRPTVVLTTQFGRLELQVDREELRLLRARMLGTDGRALPHPATSYERAAWGRATEAVVARLNASDDATASPASDE